MKVIPPPYPTPPGHSSVQTHSWLEASPDVQMTFPHPGKKGFVDLTLVAAVRICSSIITKCSTNSSHKSNSYSVILLKLSTTICLQPSKPTFCSIDMQLFRQIPLSTHQPNHSSLSGPQAPCHPGCFPPDYTSFCATSEESFTR